EPRKRRGGGWGRHAAGGSDSGRRARQAPRAASRDAADPARRRPAGHCRTCHPSDDEHRHYRRDRRHRRRPAVSSRMNLSEAEMHMDTESDLDATFPTEDVGDLDAWTLDETEYSELEEMRVGSLGEH